MILGQQPSSLAQHPRYISSAVILVFLVISLYRIDFWVDQTSSIPYLNAESSRNATEIETSDRNLRASKAKPFRLKTSTESADDWVFDVHRDGNNYGLSDEHCASTFPKLYKHIDDTVKVFENQPIIKEEIDSQATDGRTVKAMIYDGELYIISDSGLEDPFSRGMATVSAIHRALVAYPDRASLPNCEFVLYTDDATQIPLNKPTFAYTKKPGEENENIWLMPDFGFFSWPEPKVGSYAEVRRQIARVEAEVPFEEKIEKLVWRGATLNAIRHKLVQTTREKSWADVGPTQWNNKLWAEHGRLPIPDHCRYMFVAHVSGLSWSGQGKYMHNCFSVFITHNLEWAEIYDSALISSGPNQNYVKVKDDWSDLESTVHYFLAHPRKAKKIAANSVKTLRDLYLTPAAEACYWRRLIRGYGSVSYEPEFYEADNKTQRGVPFESVVLTGKVEWQAH